MLQEYINDFNPMLFKVIIIFISIVLSYFIRNVLFDLIENMLINIKHVESYSKKIVKTLRKPVEYFIIVLNIDLIIFIYNDYKTLETIKAFFGIAYVFLFTWIVFLFINSVATIKFQNIKNESSIKNEVINISLKILNFIIFIIGVLVALHFTNVDLTAVLSGLGIGGLAVALAAKDTLANFFGTLSILIGDTFSQGDWIVVDDKEGTVVEIGLRVSTIRTFDNALIAIPNSILANQDVKNWNKRSLGRRIKMSIGVKYNSKGSDIQNAVVQIRQMLQNHSGIATEGTEYDFKYRGDAKLVSLEDEHGIKKTLLVYLDEFGSSSINILVYCFSKTVNWAEWLAVKEDVMYKIMDILEKNNLEFAFPSLSIYKEN